MRENKSGFCFPLLSLDPTNRTKSIKTNGQLKVQKSFNNWNEKIHATIEMSAEAAWYEAKSTTHIWLGREENQPWARQKIDQ